MRKIPILSGVIAATLLPFTISFTAPEGAATGYGVVRLNTACAAEEGGGGGCKFNLLQICETAHSDHRFYRNNADEEVTS